MTSRSLIRCGSFALLLLTGCYKATFYQHPNAVAGARHERWSDFFIYGLVGSEHFGVREFCGPDAVAELRTGANFATGLVSMLTIGIYTPHKVYITCAAKPGRVLSSTRQFELLADRMGRPAQVAVRQSDRELTGRLLQAGARTFRVSYAEVTP